MQFKKLPRIPLAMIVLGFASFTTFTAADQDFPVIPHLPASPTVTASTQIPANTGDENPYGVAFVPPGFPQNGSIHTGDVLVANFNNNANLQGTGTTIVNVSPSGRTNLFFKSSTATGLTTALGVLRAGFVIVGSLPSTDGSGVCTEGPQGQEENVGQGSLIVLNRFGKVVKTLTSSKFLDGPWDLAVSDYGNFAQIFVSNALSGTVSRLDVVIGKDGDRDADDFTIVRQTEIASGYTHRCDSAAFLVGPTGLALNPFNDTLYVASSGDNELFAVTGASLREGSNGTGNVFISDATHLHGPLGLAIAPNGDLISAQGDAVNFDPNQISEIVEYSARGKFVAEFSIDSTVGSAFGLAIVPSGDGFRFAAVDDGINALDIWDVK
ncbi:MAG TPA: hypothetical protein VNU84_00960 [Candidatus Acidoferrum sp.]|jgi:hypothetical protein|nr:hypothetical protein [Candidatus Acidoferrum sp.]